MPAKPSPALSDEEIPRYVRRCWDLYQTQTQDLREAEKESLGFWIGGKYQWREGETESRQGNNRPWMSINRCKPAVDQIENEARNNPPGPQAKPVGGQADSDGADILEGLIREIEYRSDAKSADIMALRYAAASGRGVFEMGTEYAGERTLEQRIVEIPAPDPACYFIDPAARMPCLEDAMWGGKIRVLSKEQLIEEYGTELKVLNRSLLERSAGAVGSWMAEALNWQNDFSTTNTWTGGAQNKGPYYVCEFYQVQIERVKLRLYSDNVLRFEDEEVPAGVKVKRGDDGEIDRWTPRRRVKKWVVTAADLLETTDWPGTMVPHFYVLGPEIWRDGKRFRLSLITNAQDSQRGLNYTATSAAEIVGTMTKAPFIGYVGQFDVTNAQGFNPWDASNTQTWQYMEINPKFATDPATGVAQLLPPPQRNTWEAPIQRLMELATFFGEQIKAATAVFFEPSLPSAAQVQSGAAIKALQSQTNIGTVNWQDQLHRAKQLFYQQCAVILPKICDGQRVVTVVRPDTQHERMEINKEFPAAEMQNGKHRTKDGKLESANNITLGQYALRVTAGPSFETRREKSMQTLIDFLKIAPQTLGSPAVLAKALRLVGAGDPEIEAMADAIAPSPDGQMSPEQQQAQVQQLQGQNQQMQQVIQKLQFALAAKQPEIEAGKWKTAITTLGGIRQAEIKAGIDKAELDESQLEHFTGLAHEAGMQAEEHAHAATMQDSQQSAAAQQQQQAAQPQNEGTQE